MTTDAVIEALRNALLADPSNHAVRSHLAELLVGAGRDEEALEEAAKVLAAEPDNIGALRTAATAAAAAGQASRAAGYARLADALAPGDGGESHHGPGDFAMVVPDTAEELLEGWVESEALVEPEIGRLSQATITLSGVGGLADVKRRLELSFLAPMRNPELRVQFGKSLRGGLLLWGPPGCGKTFIARALAGELGANFYEVGLSDVLDMYVGNSERNLSSIFDAARRNRPCVLFFDEIDALGQKRSHLRHGGAALRGVVNQMLAELDGASSDNEGVFVLAASNHPWDVDSALLRPGRLDRTVLVLPPDLEAREAVLRLHLRGRPTESIDFRGLAKATDGLSGADLALACEQAAEAAMEASIESATVRPITQHQLAQAVRSIRPSIGEWLETAKNYAMYGNDSGAYDELAAYLKRRRR
ncbi:AAA family ATPase [Aeromicrobium sp.]|uniref:AAA family ATPase n=1 Tax=Aeromicrobium sp. TaxID=1871063 RepID=UPI002FC6A613